MPYDLLDAAGERWLGIPRVVLRLALREALHTFKPQSSWVAMLTLLSNLQQQPTCERLLAHPRFELPQVTQ